MSEMAKPFLKRLRLQNFRSFRDVTVEFDNPLFIVGGNGAGKSNLFDALDFLSRAMNGPLSEFRPLRGGGLASFVYFEFVDDSFELFEEQGRFTLTVDFASSLQGIEEAQYRVAYGYLPSGRSDSILKNGVIEERGFVRYTDGKTAHFNRTEAEFTCSNPNFRPAVQPDRLMLSPLAGLTEFEPLVTGISEMRVYSISPSAIRQEVATGSEKFLNTDGGNLPFMLVGLPEHMRERISEILRSIAPIHLVVAKNAVDSQPVDPRARILFQQPIPGKHPQAFNSSAMSDGTLYALGYIVALMQNPLPSVIAIEEPELYLHIESQAVLSELIELASEKTQVIVSTHSPDLIEAKWLRPENLRIVSMEDGETQVSPVTPAARTLIERGSMYPGQLLRSNLLSAK